MLRFAQDDNRSSRSLAWLRMTTAVEIKFCGMTRAEDAREAARLGASYVGVIFAGGPRQLTVARAGQVFEGLPAGVRRVGVFASDHERVIADAAQRLGLHVVQLHG